MEYTAVEIGTKLKRDYFAVPKVSPTDPKDKFGDQECSTDGSDGLPIPNECSEKAQKKMIRKESENPHTVTEKHKEWQLQTSGAKIDSNESRMNHEKKKVERRSGS